MRIVVIGAGVVGLACARALVKDGHAVRVVERAVDGDRASFGNAGGLAVSELAPASAPGIWKQVPRWLVDPLGPLSVRPGHALKLLPWLRRFLATGRPEEIARISTANAAIGRRATEDMADLLAEVGLPGDLRRDGALTLYESEAGFEADRADWTRRAEHGFPTEALSGDEARAMEPAISTRVVKAVYDPSWSLVADPRRVVEGLERWLREREVPFHEAEATALEPGLDRVRIMLADGSAGDADIVVVAAGAWSARLAESVGDRALLESERGYNVTIPRPNVSLTRQLVFAERKFVATPLAIGLRIGGAAEFAGLDAPARLARADALARLAKIYLPDLDTSEATRWMGQRPSTPDGLPVIGWSPGKGRVIYAFGHGHLGLTQSATTGRLVAGLLSGDTGDVDMEPYSIARFRR
ncbi:NAD(P)/FAD-dependent oxidoreductase [Salinarimonas ramus]|uniref:Amino acid dehydrogenase n=1 Tax=Salinarimonas ramus TaxID=690164 RepID=A0A917Q643_9HYPH|nr:FAD-dependent oxidoreductase [Salinarimonas ramus]GGK28858.1 amino acid dehydrogenase [Salinarimonas ramus]